MNKKIEKKNFLTADEIKDLLLKELDSFVENLPITEKRKTLESDLAEVKSLADLQTARVREYDAKITELQAEINAAKPEKLPGLSKKMRKLGYDREEAGALLDTLSERRTAIEKELSNLQNIIQPELLGFLRARTKKYEQEVSGIIHDMVEPRLSGWEGFAFESTRRFGFDLSKLFNEFEIKVHSPLLEEACKNVMSEESK